MLKKIKSWFKEEPKMLKYLSSRNVEEENAMLNAKVPERIPTKEHILALAVTIGEELYPIEQSLDSYDALVIENEIKMLISDEGCLEGVEVEAVCRIIRNSLRAMKETFQDCWMGGLANVYGVKIALRALPYIFKEGKRHGTLTEDFFKFCYGKTDKDKIVRLVKDKNNRANEIVDEIKNAIYDIDYTVPENSDNRNEKK